MTISKEDERTPGLWRSLEKGNIVDGHGAAIACALRQADAEFIAQAVNAYTSTDALRSALAAYEKWEADLIGSNEAWYTREREPLELPWFTQALWDRLLEIQAMRNAALSASPAPSTEGLRTPEIGKRAERYRDSFAGVVQGNCDACGSCDDDRDGKCACDHIVDELIDRIVLIDEEDADAARIALAGVTAPEVAK